ncbi:DNA topoisomerase 2 [Tulasnella sp. UAMH 9824]|nr:DNA topoisomerase 2 [Tulasnella sp. UAMH 9824]
MSDSEVENFSFNNDSDGSDFASPPPKAKAKKAATATKESKKPAAAKPAKAPKAAASKKKPLESVDDNVDSAAPTAMDVDDSDDDAFGESSKPKKPVAAAPGKKKTASETYQQLSPIQHILKRPDSYIGSIETITEKLWVFDSDTKRMVFRDVSYVPGFFKIVDEILVNAADNKINDPNMNTLKVTIDPENNTISVWNNGHGIPVEIHSQTKLWIPEMIFGHLLTSSNYDDDEKKLTGGRNGYGAKLTNIYSTEFTLETADRHGKKYKQVFRNNMADKDKPKITSSKEEFTCVTFKPDLKRFGMSRIDEDTEALLKKRVYDMAGTVSDIKVLLNGERVKVKNFRSYCEMYLASAQAEAADASGGAAVTKQTLIHEVINDRWEVGYALSDTGNFQQVSFTNSIATIKGGTHVNAMADQIIKSLITQIEKKNKAAKVKPLQIKNHMWLFVKALIENPTFDSQTKETMTLQASKFGGKKPVLTDDFMKKETLVSKSGIIDTVLNWAKFKADQQIKATDGKKRTRLNGLTKLSDANNAGGRHASKCTLILTEGDSAKALAEAGLSVVGRDNFGVFPLRGKLLNVREATHDQIMKNTEIQNIKKIVGLVQGKQYQDLSSLRYGSVMIMTDQDHDGSHIKGLLLNLFDQFFPSLLRIPGFLVEFVTPIVRVTKGKQKIDFFTLIEFQKWNEENNSDNKWTIKYYKGLGTSDDNDAMEYFSHTEKHVIPFSPLQDGDRDLIDMAFSKKRPGTFIDHDVDEIGIPDFINKELICFSMADNIRSIPCVVDGLKPGQRKVIFGCFKRKMKAELKVAQLIGYISEKTAYHHGEQSLASTIINLAQTFVGANNINLLSPNGQYGTRAMGGKDHASPRYIFTIPTTLARSIFHLGDDPLLKYLEDDGDSIEPEWYVPVIPMILVNGSEGIGTGYSTNIPNFNPHDIVANLRRMLRDEPLVPMKPWYRGFKGAIEKVDEGKFSCNGIINKLDDSTVEITELPIGTWTQPYKEQLEKWVTGTDNNPAYVKDYKEYHTNTSVHFVITMTKEGMAKAEEEGLLKFFKLTGSINTTNMMAFDSNLKLRKYASPEEIMEDFFPLRLQFYQKRKEYLCNQLRDQWDKLSNQARFVQMIIDKKLVVAKRKKADLVNELRKLEFRAFPRVSKAKAAGEDEPAEDDDEEEASTGTSSDFDYLLGMAIWSLTEEKVAKLLRERDVKEQELNVLLAVKPSEIWENDLEKLLDDFEKLLEGDNAINKKASKGKKAAATLKTRKSLTGGKPKRKGDDDDSEDDFKPSKAAQKKTAPAKPKAAARAKAVFDDEETKPQATKMEVDSEPDEALVVKKKAPVKKPALPESDSDEDVKPVVAKAKPAAKKAAAKRKSLASDDDLDEDVKPAKKAKPLDKKQTELASFFEAGGSKAKPAAKPSATASAKAKATTSKKAQPALDLDDDSDAPVVKKKAAGKKKVVESSDPDSEIEVVSAPAPRAAPRRAAAAPAKSKYLDAFDSSEADPTMDEDDDDAFDE